MNMIEWLYLSLAILFEGAGTTMMKLSSGGERIIESVLIGVFYLICFGFLTLALKGIPISIAYAIWSGLGILIAVAVGYFLFDEPVTALKAIAVTMVIAGVGLLSYSSH
jgi:small multidrug resistance pump